MKLNLSITLKYSRLRSAIAIVGAYCVMGSQLSYSQAPQLIEFPEVGQGIPELLVLAIQNNPLIRSQEAGKRSAEADVKTSKWQYYPTPSISLERASSQNNDPTYANGAQVRYFRLQQPLFTWGRLSAGVSKAQARQIAAVAAVEESKQQVAMRVVQAYSEWAAAWLKRQAYLEGYQDHKNFQGLITRRIETGVSPSADLVLVRSRLEQMQGDLLQSIAQQDNARIKIAQLLGQPVEEVELRIEPLSNVKKLLARPAQDWVERSENSSPTLARLNAQATAARMELEERKSSMRPDIYLRAEHQQGNPYTIAQQADQTRVFVGLSGNLGAGLSGFSTVSAGAARYEAALEEVDVGRRSLQEQISSDLSALKSAADRHEVLRNALQFSQDLQVGGERQFLAGRRSWQELMNTSRELVQSKTQLAEVRASILLLTWRLSLLGDQVDAVLEPQYFLE